ALGPALLAALLVGMVIALLLAALVVPARAHPLVAGMALHFACLGATALLFARHPALGSVTTFDQLASPWRHAPWIGAALLPFGLAALLGRTRFGLHLRAAGDHPAALRAAGGHPARVRVLALALAGALGGLAGATLTTVLSGTFVDGMSGGRGFLALALVLFARWRPLGALAAGLFVALLMTVELRLGADAARHGQGFAVFALRALPWVATITALALRRPDRSAAPGALNEPLD
ncbi:MAG: ABC transporter permease, partial [Planctomycetes bacterium]|nr:ABC transporter permease [Planctomycetota bacterium]